MMLAVVTTCRISSKVATEDKLIKTKQVGPMWLFDITDFVNYSIWSGTCVGIQRVEFEIARAIRHRSDVFVFSTFDGVFWDMTELLQSSDLNVDELIDACRKKHPIHLLPKRGIRPRVTRVFYQIQRRWRQRIAAPLLQSGDRILVAGTWWDHDELYDRCLKAQDLGLNIITVVYDLIPLLHCDLTGHDYIDRFESLLKIPMHICSISKYSAHELKEAERMGKAVAPKSLRVTPLAHEFPGVARNDTSFPLHESILGLTAGRPFVLCVGTVEIRKNHLKLLEAWDELGRSRGATLPLLVIAGKRGWKAELTIERLTNQQGVLFVESPKDHVLRSLYSSCLFTVFPSFFEGWGLPVGESLWFGKACAASNATTMPEVGEDLCVYFDPHDQKSMMSAIEILLDDEKRAELEDRIKHAPLRTWADVGISISRVIEDLSV